MRRTKIMWVTVAVVAAMSLFFAGLATGIGIGGRSIITGNFADGFNTAKSMLDKTGLIPPTPEKIMSVSGTIASVKGNQITITGSRVATNPLENQGPAKRTINATDKTSIIALVPLSTAEMANANKKFMADLAAHNATQPPSPFKEVVAKLSDLKTGMIITVTSATDIKNATTISAIKITFQGTLAGK